MLQCLCYIFDHSTVCLLCSRAACRWSLEMTPCLNFTEVAPDTLFCQWLTFTAFPNNLFIFSTRKYQSGPVCFLHSLCCAALCCGPLTPPTGHLPWASRFYSIWGEITVRAQDTWTSFWCKIELHQFFTMLGKSWNYGFHKIYFFTPVSRESKVIS